MQQVEAAIGRIARSRVRDALLELTRDGPRTLRRTTIATRAAVDPAVVESVMHELETNGPFEVERLETTGEPRWRVV